MAADDPCHHEPRDEVERRHRDEEEIKDFLEHRRAWKARRERLGKFAQGVLGTMVTASIITGQLPPFISRLWAWTLSWLNSLSK